MKKGKRRIKTFKNWLLARDSASRISTDSNYIGFFEDKEEDNDNKKDNDLFFRRLRPNR
jgi:hypothetical protein